MANWKVGDPLVLGGVNTRGRTYDGTITKVGRSLVTIDAPHSGMTGYQFRIDTGRWNNQSFGHQWWIKTPQEHAEIARRAEVVETLSRVHRIDVYRASLPLSTLEAILRAVQGVDE